MIATSVPAVHHLGFAGLNPPLIRLVLFALFYLVVRYFRAAKSRSPQPASEIGTSKVPQLGEALRDTMRKAGKWVGPRGGYSVEEESPPDELNEPVQVSQQLEQLPAIEPESSSFPSLLLLALLACLCLMAYQYWAR